MYNIMNFANITCHFIIDMEINDSNIFLYMYVFPNIGFTTQLLYYNKIRWVNIDMYIIYRRVYRQANNQGNT